MLLLNLLELPKVIFLKTRQKAINEVRAQKADELIAEMQLSVFARLADENQTGLSKGFEKESFKI